MMMLLFLVPGGLSASLISFGSTVDFPLEFVFKFSDLGHVKLLGQLHHHFAQIFVI